MAPSAVRPSTFLDIFFSETTSWTQMSYADSLPVNGKAFNKFHLKDQKVNDLGTLCVEFWVYAFQVCLNDAHRLSLAFKKTYR